MLLLKGRNKSYTKKADETTQGFMHVCFV